MPLMGLGKEHLQAVHGYIAVHHSFSPPPVVVAAAMVRSAALGATVSIGLLRPTITTAVAGSTSIRAAGAGTTAIGLTVAPFGRSPKNKL